MDKAVTLLKKYKYALLLSLFIVLVFVLPQFFMQLPRGHDIYYHMYRLDSLASELKNGNFNVRIYSTMFDGYGYASPMFYGDWFMVPAALLICMGMPAVNAYAAFLLMCVFLTATSMYFSAKYMFGSRRAAFTASFTYVFSVYFFVDMFWRHAVGEVQSFIFLPIVMAGLYSIVIKDCKYWYLLGLGMCGMVVSHLLTSVVTVLFLILFCLAYIPRFVRQPKKFMYIVSAAVLFFLSAASFIFPLIEQMSTTAFVGTDGTSATVYGTLLQRSMPDLISLINPMNNRCEYSPYIPDGVGIVFILPLAYLIFFRKDYKGKPTYIFFALAALALFATSYLFPWDALQELCGILQFPWRLMIFASLFIALFVGSVAPENKAGFAYSSLVMLLAVSALMFTLAPKFGTYLQYAQNGTTVPYDYEYNIGMGEYLPSGINHKTMIRLAQNGDVYYAQPGSVTAYIRRENNVLHAGFDGFGDEGGYIDLPLINYVGYAAYIDHDGVREPAVISYGKDNLVRVAVDPGIKSGYITVLYEGTAVQNISYYITALTLASFFGYLLSLLYKKIKARFA